MGVHPAIGRFFVDRQPPQNNSFWKKHVLYIAFGNGFVSIPVYYDLLYRIGVPMEVLLNEKHILFMEQLMHFAILQERNEISREEELESVRGMLQGRIQNKHKYEQLSQYLDQPVLKTLGSFGTAFPSLNRADLFLYILCDLPLTDAQWEKALHYWYALHPTYLISDDIGDYASDKEEGEENLIIELGDDAGAFEKAVEMIRQNAETMREINPVLANYLLLYEDTVRPFIPVNK